MNLRDHEEGNFKNIHYAGCPKQQQVKLQKPKQRVYSNEKSYSNFFSSFMRNIHLSEKHELIFAQPQTCHASLGTDQSTH